MDTDSRFDPGMALAVEAAGSQSALGRIVGRPQQTIHDRLHSGKPLWAEDVLKVEAATGASRHDLRPDVYPREPDGQSAGEAA